MQTNVTSLLGLETHRVCRLVFHLRFNTSDSSYGLIIKTLMS